MDAGGRDETSGTENKYFIIHSNNSNKKTSNFAGFPVANSNSKMQSGPGSTYSQSGLHHKEGTLSLCQLNRLYHTVNIPDF